MRQYAEIGRIATEAVAAFAADVRAGTFPNDAESYHGSAELGTHWPRRLNRRGPRGLALGLG